MMEATCLCGAVRIATEPVKEQLFACHCDLCTHWTGATQFGFSGRADATTVTGPVRDHASTGFSTRAWCDRCGTALWIRDGDGDYEFTAGLFPQTRDWPLHNENYVDTTWPVMRLAGEHTRYTRAEYEAANKHVEGSRT